MIKLVVAEYCHDCPSFNATCDTVFDGHNRPSHYIKCLNSDECRHIRQYIETQLVERERFREALCAINDLNKQMEENNNAEN